MSTVAESLKEFYELEVTPSSIGILYLGYSGLLLRTVNYTLAFDVDELIPRTYVKNIEKLDLLLFTHGHYDHFEERVSIELHKLTGAKVMCEESVYNRLKDKVPDSHLIKATAGVVTSIDGVSVEVIRGRHVGPIVLYLVELDEVRIFHGGDSDYVPLYPRRADIAIVPTGAPSPTASPDSAYRTVVDLRPSVVIPVHGKESQHRKLESKLKKHYPEVKVQLVEPFKPLLISLGEHR